VQDGRKGASAFLAIGLSMALPALVVVFLEVIAFANEEKVFG
jgi:hypothetical protein